ncbi:hypothetical protein Bbelb_282600 [Branchiostoma belcheri]|nr:hypothetical protein Bbelb_282600 [Branchiostoma belcheri]
MERCIGLVENPDRADIKLHVSHVPSSAPLTTTFDWLLQLERAHRKDAPRPRLLVFWRRGSFYRVQCVIATRSYHVAGRTARLVPGALKKRGKSMCMTEGFVQPAPSLDKLGLLGELSAHSPDGTPKADPLSMVTRLANA